jgi:hypothetical protein
MKKIMNLFFAFAFFVNAKAQVNSDPTLEQQNITRDAVHTLIESFEQEAHKSYSSADTDVFVKNFSANASRVLLEYENTVKNSILVPLKVPLSVYLTNRDPAVDDQLKKVVDKIAQSKVQVLERAKLNLYTILLPSPLKLRWDESYRSVIDNPICAATPFINCTLTYYTTSKISKFDSVSGWQLATTITYERNKYDSGRIRGFTYTNFDEETQRKIFKDRENLVRELTKNCFSQSCFYTLISTYNKWFLSISSKFEKVNIAGFEIEAFPAKRMNNNEWEKMELIFNAIITQALGNPLSSSDHRTLSETELAKDRINKSAVRDLKDQLCRETELGCLTDSEKDLFTLTLGKSVNNYLK